MIPAKIASLPDALITTGNHNIEIGGVISELKPHPHAYLGHFQIRSKNQFLTKNLIKRLQLRITILPKLPEFNPYFSLHNQRQLNSIKENASMFEEDFLNASQIWLENYKGENVDLVEDQFLYQGGDLKYSHIITSNQGWLTVFNFCEMLASRHGALLSTLDHKGKELFEEESKIITSLRLNLDKMLDDLLEKEKVIQDQHRHLLEKEQIIQDLRRHLLEKEQVIQDQRHRLRLYLKNTFKKFERIRLKIKMAFLYCASLVRQIIDIIIRPS